MQHITVTLGEKDYRIQQKPLKITRAWRKQFKDSAANQLLGLIAGNITLELQTVQDLARVAQQALGLFLESFDAIYDLLLAYATELHGDQAYLDDHATDAQIVNAFMEVVKLAIPLPWTQIQAQLPGLASLMTSPSLPPVNGDSPAMTSTPLTASTPPS